MNEVAQRLNNGDTISIALDYYGLYNISKVCLDAIDKNIFYYIFYDVNNGYVVKIKVWYKNKIHWVRM